MSHHKMVSSSNIICQPTPYGPSIQYKKLRQLGRGGFATCFQVQRLTDNKKFAIKIIKVQSQRQRQKSSHHHKDKPKPSQKVSLISKARQQAKILSSLNHGNIVKYCSDFMINDEFFIVMELCQFGSLSEILKKRLVLTEVEVRYYVCQIVHGLIYLKKMNVIHRDLKPANFLIDSKMKVKIADFGLATYLGYTSMKDKNPCGTPNYISPEMLNKQDYSFEVDVWSIGVIMYTMLYGVAPFQTRTKDANQTYSMIKKCMYNLNSPAVSKQAKDLISKILVQRPKDRITLEEILEHQFIRAYNVPFGLPSVFCYQEPGIQFLQVFQKQNGGNLINLHRKNDGGLGIQSQVMDNRNNINNNNDYSKNVDNNKPKNFNYSVLNYHTNYNNHSNHVNVNLMSKKHKHNKQHHQRQSLSQKKNKYGPKSEYMKNSHYYKNEQKQFKNQKNQQKNIIIINKKKQPNQVATSSPQSLQHAISHNNNNNQIIGHKIQFVKINPNNNNNNNNKHDKRIGISEQKIISQSKQLSEKDDKIKYNDNRRKLLIKDQEKQQQMKREQYINMRKQLSFDVDEYVKNQLEPLQVRYKVSTMNSGNMNIIRKSQVYEKYNKFSLIINKNNFNTTNKLEKLINSNITISHPFIVSILTQSYAFRFTPIKISYLLSNNTIGILFKDKSSILISLSEQKQSLLIFLIKQLAYTQNNLNKIDNKKYYKNNGRILEIRRIEQNQWINQEQSQEDQENQYMKENLYIYKSKVEQKGVKRERKFNKCENLSKKKKYLNVQQYEKIQWAKQMYIQFKEKLKHNMREQLNNINKKTYTHINEPHPDINQQQQQQIISSSTPISSSTFSFSSIQSLIYIRQYNKFYDDKYYFELNNDTKILVSMNNVDNFNINNDKNNNNNREMEIQNILGIKLNQQNKKRKDSYYYYDKNLKNRKKLVTITQMVYERQNDRLMYYQKQVNNHYNVNFNNDKIQQQYSYDKYSKSSILSEIQKNKLSNYSNKQSQQRRLFKIDFNFPHQCPTLIKLDLPLIHIPTHKITLSNLNELSYLNYTNLNNLNKNQSDPDSFHIQNHSKFSQICKLNQRQLNFFKNDLKYLGIGLKLQNPFFYMRIKQEYNRIDLITNKNFTDKINEQINLKQQFQQDKQENQIKIKSKIIDQNQYCQNQRDQNIDLCKNKQKTQELDKVHHYDNKFNCKNYQQLMSYIINQAKQVFIKPNGLIF